MRQIVSIVNDGFIRYYLAEGSDLEEVARIRVGEKFSPEQAVILGINVVEAVGKIAPSREPVVVAAVEAPAPPKSKPPTPRKGPKAERIVWKDTVTYDRIERAMRTKPDGMTGQEIAAMIGYPSDPKARKAVANRLGVMRADGKVGSRRDSDGDYLWFLVAAQQPIPVAQPIGSPIHAGANGVLPVG